MLPILFGVLGIAVGAVAGACTAHATGEKDRQAAKHHRQVANELTNKYNRLKKQYDEFACIGKEQTSKLIQEKLLKEVENDSLRLAIRLQQSLIDLMWGIDRKPTVEALNQFQVAIQRTNYFLSQLNEELIFVPNDYYIRNFKKSVEHKNFKEFSSPRKYKYAVYLSPGYKDNIEWGGYHVTVTGFSKFHAGRKSQQRVLKNIWNEIHNSHPYSFRHKIEHKDYWIETKQDKKGNDLGYVLCFKSNLLQQLAVTLKQQNFKKVIVRNNNIWYFTLNIPSYEDIELARLQFEELKKLDWKLWLVREPSQVCKYGGKESHSNDWQEI